MHLSSSSASHLTLVLTSFFVTNSTIAVGSLACATFLDLTFESILQENLSKVLPRSVVFSSVMMKDSEDQHPSLSWHFFSFNFQVKWSTTLLASPPPVGTTENVRQITYIFLEELSHLHKDLKSLGCIGVDLNFLA